MAESHGAFTHESIMALPYRTFLGYCRAISRRRRRVEAARYFGGATLAEEWEANREAWLRAQPPPGR